MKKYVKPDLYYENFELSHSVASCVVGAISGSDLTANSQTKETCAYIMGAVKLFTDKEICNANPDELYAESYCVQTGSLVNNFFAS